MKIKVKLTDGAPMPKYAKPGDAGMDLTSREDVELKPFETRIVGTGVSVEIPEGYVGLLFPRSGLASKRGITLAHAVGVIDSGYRGEIKAPLFNATTGFNYVDRDERICQLVIMPFNQCELVEVDELEESERGDTGFGSSGCYYDD